MISAIAVALVLSRLDHANSIVYGTSQANVQKLQCIQNCVAKLVPEYPYISLSAALKFVHWLPITRRIDFKICTLTYKLIRTQTPSYLASLIHSWVPTRALHSSEQDLLHQPFASTAIGYRAFQVAAPTVWNSIPVNIRHAQSLCSFRHLLETHIFTVSD